MMSKMKRRAVLFCMLMVVAAIATTTTTVAGAASNQFTLFDATDSQTSSSYYQPSFSSPANWSTPDNFYGGTAYWRVQVMSKPSSLPTLMQVCMWRQSYAIETCSGYTPTITDEGTFWVKLGAPQNWWKKNGNWSPVRPDVVRIMVKDKASGRLMQRSSCGAYCYPRSDLDNHVPIQINSQLIVVAKGAALQPPSKWVGSCPSSWSPGCTGGGGSTTTTTAPPSGGSRVVSIQDGSLLEPDTGSLSLPFKLTLSQASASAVSVRVNIAPGTATPYTDYDTRGGSVLITFNAGQTVAWVGFSVYGDTVSEADETVKITLSNPIGATIGDGAAIGVIVNDDGGGGSTTTTTAPPSGGSRVVSIQDGSLLEPDTGSLSLPFKLTLSQASASAVSVRVNIAPGTATPYTDYDTRGGSVLITFNAGQTSAWVGFSVYGDTVREANETVKITLSNPIGATIGDGAAIGVIVNDD